MSTIYPDKAAQIISCWEEWLLAAGTITDRFTAAEIQGGVLKDHLIPEDYLAPQKVITHNLIIVYIFAHMFSRDQ